MYACSRARISSIPQNTHPLCMVGRCLNSINTSQIINRGRSFSSAHFQKYFYIYLIQIKIVKMLCEVFFQFEQYLVLIIHKSYLSMIVKWYELKQHKRQCFCGSGNITLLIAYLHQRKSGRRDVGTHQARLRFLFSQSTLISSTYGKSKV